MQQKSIAKIKEKYLWDKIIAKTIDEITKRI
jgi:hypothetical protein